MRTGKVICVTPKAAENVKPKRLCEMVQELLNSKTNQRVLAVSFQIKLKGEANLTVISPFGLRISEGVSLQLNGAELLHLAINTCLPIGCISNNNIVKDKMEKIDEGQTIIFQMKDLANRDLEVKVSLSGFAPALKRLKNLTES